MQKSQNIFSRAIKDGFFFILPLGITIGIVFWIWSFLKKLVPDLTTFLPIEWFKIPYLYYIFDILFLVLVVLGITFFGMLASTFFGKFVHILIDRFLMAPTFVRPLYNTFKKMAELFFKNNSEQDQLSKNLSMSILIPYPNAYTRSIAFITSNHARHIFGPEEGNDWVTIYVPSAPLVSAGFFLICRKEDLEPCLLKSGPAMTTIISVGTAQPEELKETSILLDSAPISNKKNYFSRWFFNGILLLGPLIATIWIFVWIGTTLYTTMSYFVTLFPPILSNVIPENLYTFILSSCLMIIIMILIIIIGLIGHSALGIWFQSITAQLFNVIPMINKIYNIVNKIIVIFSPDPSKNNKFNQAVLVPYPTEKTYAIGFVTGKNCSMIKTDGDTHLPIFIPTTPIPTTGWFVTYPKDQVIPLNMSIDKAFALVISSGILTEENDTQ